MTTAAEQTAESGLVTIAGGVDIEVAHNDGTKETVKVRQIPVSEIQQFIIALSDKALTKELASREGQKIIIDTVRGSRIDLGI